MKLFRHIALMLIAMALFFSETSFGQAPMVSIRSVPYKGRDAIMRSDSKSLDLTREGKNADGKLGDMFRKVKGQLSGARIGLVFGGGGAKAAAEIGVLKVLESLGIRVSLISGSSMGAVVGGLYAAGFSAEEIEELFLTEEWLALFDKDMIGASEGEGRTVFGLVKGEIFQEKLHDALKKKTGVCKLKDVKIPFRCTATNVVDDELEEYVFSVEKDPNVDLALAIRASMTYPAPIVGFRHVVYDGKKLVDGGMLNNLPVDVIKDDVDVVIAIDLEQVRKNDRKGSILGNLGVGKIVNAKLNDFIGVDLQLGWLLDWMESHPDTNKHNQNMREAKREGNIYMNPDLTGYSILRFETRHLKKMIEYGEMEANRHIDQLRSLNNKLKTYSSDSFR